MAVEDASYKKALEALAKKRGWSFKVEYYDRVKDYVKYRKMDELFVETPESCLVSCMRVWTALKYACNALNRQTDKSLFDLKGVRLKDDAIKELIDEAVEKVIESASGDRDDEEERGGDC
ncbi:MAG: hypothetical protein QXX95_03785 [Nitrososphaerales archaeon]